MVFDEFDLDDVEDYTKAISMPMKDDNAASLVADKHSSSLPSAASDKGHVAGLDKNATSSSVESTPPSTKINNKPLAASKPQQPFSSTSKGSTDRPALFSHVFIFLTRQVSRLSWGPRIHRDGRQCPCPGHP